MAYQILSGGGEWMTQTPSDTLKALLDEYPLGVSFLTDGGKTVKWRKTPRDEALIADIHKAIVGYGPYPEGTAAGRVYELLENRGVL